MTTASPPHAAPLSPSRAIVLGAAEGRTPAPLNIVGEETLVKVGPVDSDGQLAAFHLVAPPMSGPPLHVHTREDEWFYVLEGEIVFLIDGERVTVGPGGSVWLRRGVPHAYQNFTDRDARLLIVTTPGDFCNFFIEVSAAAPPGGMPEPEVFRAIDAKYGITTLGPPMSSGTPRQGPVVRPEGRPPSYDTPRRALHHPTHSAEDTTMHRRTFMGVTLPAVFGVALTGCDAGDALDPSPTVDPGRPFVLGPDEGRTPEPLLVVGETGLAKIRGDDCGGQFCLFHFVAPPMSGPPLHVHSREDEWFYVLDGEIVFQLDGVRHTVGPGGLVYSPRDVVHAYQNFTDRDARLLIATMPGAFGVMFEEMSAATPPGGMPSVEVLEALHEKYGITTMGPPLMA